jgi:hypothetical protein
MKSRLLASIAATLVFVGSSGCAPHSRGEMPWWPWAADEAPVVPQWVATPPQPTKTTLSSVGTSGRTLIPENGKGHAIAIARHDLAGSLRIHVDSLAGEVNELGKKDIFMKVSMTEINDTLESSIVRAVWFDREGVAGPKGTHYAWVEVEFSDLIHSNR